MPTDTYEVLWLSQSQTVSLTELAMLAGLTEEEVRDLVDNGALAPVNPHDAPWNFSADCVIALRQVSRLRDDLELEPHALALALGLLEQIRALESELSKMRAQQARFDRA